MLKIKIDTRNSAFDGLNKRFEIERCLKSVIDRINGCDDEGNIHDSNGNNVGNYTLTNR